MMEWRRQLAVVVLALSAACGGSTSAVPEPPSCAQNGDGRTNCGAAAESCCTTLSVTGGSLAMAPVIVAGTVSDFDLDKYDVTVGRFRLFAAAWMNGYVPPPGSGKHVNLHGGKGLINSGDDAGTTYETGWVASDDANLNPTTAALSCDGDGTTPPPTLPTFYTWTDTPGTHETLPINCVNWWEAYAFCIWDGGFLPSLNEGMYATTGGSEGRAYAWGTTPPGKQNKFAIYGCYYDTMGAVGQTGSTGCESVQNIAPVGTAPSGAGRWGQLDLMGDVNQWQLDYASPTAVGACSDCAYLEATPTLGQEGVTAPQRQDQGGFYGTNNVSWGTNPPNPSPPSTRSPTIGFRCERTL